VDQAADSISTFKKLDQLHWEIMRFLWSTPNKGKEHPYRLKHLRPIQENIVEAVATGQYVLFRDDKGDIEHFIAYWKVREEDIELIREGIKPLDRCHGDKLYIVEHGNKGGRKSFVRMGKALKEVARGNTGVFWHSWNRHKFMVFKNKKGAE